MAKGKSSASSATRKKHEKQAAKKAGAGEDDDAPNPQQPPQRGQKKTKKNRFEPKVKSYVPPPPPPKGAPDPVDLYLNGGKGIDPELVVVLRRLGKRDEATVGKGVEGLEQWVREVMKEEQHGVEEGDEWKLERKREEVVESMAVWAHHFPRLSLHPSRRLRLQTHALHTLLSSKPSHHRASPLLALTRSALLAPLWIEQKEYVGAWCCSAFDGDRAVRNAARRGWDQVVLVAPPSEEGEEQADAPEGISLHEHGESIFDFAAGLVLAPAATPDPGAEATDDPSLVKTQALLALSYLLSTLPSPLPLADETQAVLANEELWELASPEQPAALRRALYEVLGAVAARKNDELLGGAEGLKVVSSQVLRNCWGEDEGWAGVIAFLRRYPEAWSLADEAIGSAASSKPTSDDGDSDDEDDGESDDDDEEAPPVVEAPTASSSTAFTPSPTLSLFLTHLTLACTGHPSNYPTILLLLSTLPASVLPPTPDALSLLFESFWAAWGGRALSVGATLSASNAAGGPSAIEEFVTAFLESLLWELAALQKAGGEGADALVKEWVGRVFTTYLGVGETGSKTQRGIATKLVAERLEGTLSKLAGREEALFAVAWAEIEAASSNVLGASHNIDVLSTFLPPLATALSALTTSKSELVQTAARTLTVASIEAAASGVAQDDGSRLSALLPFIASTRQLVPSDEKAIQSLDALATSHISSLFSTSPALALSFLTQHLTSTSAASRDAIWSTLFTPAPSTSTILALIHAVGEGALSADLPSAGLDTMVIEFAERALGDDSGAYSAAELEILMSLMVQPQPFVESTTPTAILSLIGNRLPSLATRSLSPSPPELSLLNAPSRLLAHFTQVRENAQSVLEIEGLAIAVFEVAYLVGSCRLDDSGLELPAEAIFASQQTWEALTRVGGDAVLTDALARLSEYLVDPVVRPSPVETINAAATLLSSSTIPLTLLLPAPATYTRLFTSLPLSPPSPALSVLTPLVPQSTDDSTSPAPLPSTVDSASLTSYARTVLAILEVSARDHSWLRRNLWVLPHVLFLGDVARDELASSGATLRVGVFGKSVREDVLERVVASADGLAAYVLSAAANELPEGWHGEAVKYLRVKDQQAEPTDEVVRVLSELVKQAREEESGVYARRGFETVLKTVLRYTDGGVQDAERWLAWGQSLPDGSPLAASIVYAIKSVLMETPRFERYQNELASMVAGVPSSAASSKGLRLLRVLLATAPSPDAPVIFLPQQRSMFLIQCIQRWIGSDDDLDEEIHSAVAELFIHLAPIVQELSGSHWDLVFDIVESNLETASWDEPITLAPLYHSCRLLATIKDLATTNSELKLTAKARIDKSLELVRDLFVSRPESGARNAPRLLVLESMARLIRDLPPKLLVMGPSFDQLLHLLRDPSLAVQHSAYSLVTRIAAKHVSDLVVEVELDTDEGRVIDLPDELIKLLEARVSDEVLQTPEEYSSASTYMLAWLVAFQFFENASPRIKAGYIDHLRQLDLVKESLLPSLFALLSLSDRSRVVDVTPWSIDEFHLELMDDLTAVTLPVFATWTYYRSLQALPSLVRQWWEGCKNRQLSMAVSSFTSRHFSPVLIAAELAHLRDPDDPAGKALRDNDDFTVKVAGGANEVKAVFVVDEESMEIGIKLPAEFPLQQVEVKDVRKVGVTDAQWRSWLLGVQQVITNQNGLIADALSLFKRNVTLHFEGTEACAICYSVIAVTDRSLPTKSCKTCNNRFHAGCLYKWFSTSHGSSCPLCRSLF